MRSDIMGAMIANRLRTELDLPPGISDAEILQKTEGTFIRARIEFSIALSDLWNAVKESLGRWGF